MEDVEKQIDMVSDRAQRVERWLVRWEPVLVFLFMWLVFISIPIYLGRIGLSWDGLNHQIYLGWVADSPRFDRDYMAASLQAYQFPYLYWPVYKLAISGVSGITAGIVLSSLHLIVVPPVWMISKSLIPGKDLLSIGLRTAAVILAFLSAVPLKTLEATGNDLLAAAPMLWAIALIFQAIAHNKKDVKISLSRTAVLSGLLAGIATAAKLSNGPLVLLLPGLFFFVQEAPRERVRLVVLHIGAMAAGFLVTYGYWGYQLWLQFGNPFFPFYDPYFEPVRHLLGWHR